MIWNSKGLFFDFRIYNSFLLYSFVRQVRVQSCKPKCNKTKTGMCMLSTTCINKQQVFLLRTYLKLKENTIHICFDLQPSYQTIFINKLVWIHTYVRKPFCDLPELAACLVFQGQQVKSISWNIKHYKYPYTTVRCSKQILCLFLK